MLADYRTHAHGRVINHNGLEPVPAPVACSWRPRFRKEKTLRDLVFEHADVVLSELGLPPAVEKQRERPPVRCQQGTKFRIRCDVCALHESGAATIFETKRVSDVNAMSMAVAQLLAYQQMMIDLGFEGRVNLVAVIDGAIQPFAFRMNERLGLGIRFVQATPEGFSVVEGLDEVDSVKADKVQA